MIIAVVVPILALAVICVLDRHGVPVVLVLVALVWGVVSTELAKPLNEDWVTRFGLTSLVVLGAPIIEEICKSLALPWLSLSRRCTWFVDGALLGLASGTGFAIRENLIYLDRAPDGTDLSLALARVTSTNLMHAGCTAIVGAGVAVTIGLPIVRRMVVGLGALLVAMSLHSSFNRLTDSNDTVVALTVLGLVTFGIAAVIVAMGVPVSRRWAESAMAARGEAAGERAIMGRSGDVADLLDRFEARFGGAAAEKLERLIVVQRRIGVLSHASTRSSADGARDPQLVALHDEADSLRRSIGLFPMGWLRSHLPTESRSGLWAALDTATGDATEESTAVGATSDPGGAPTGLWAALADRDDGLSAPGGTSSPVPDDA